MKQFLDKVSKSGPIPKHSTRLGRCWLWIGGTGGKTGYGKFHMNGRLYGAHQVSWILFRGEIPAPNGRALWVLHKCDNRICVNPGHLFLGSPADNFKDMVDKGRYRNGSAFGERNARSKLTVAQALMIKSSAESGPALAQKCGVSRHTVNKIRAGTAWRHLNQHVADQLSGRIHEKN